MPRQPVFNVPSVVLALLVLLALVHAGRTVLPEAADAHLLERAAFVPGRVTVAFAPDRVTGALATLARADPAPDGPAAVGLFFLGDGTPQPWTAVSYALLHGDWTHLGLNAVWLLAFGAPVARRTGPARFLVFNALGALAGAAVHWAVDPVSLQPLVGASAAVSASMGAAARFAFSGRAGGFAPVADAPRLSLPATLKDPRARAFLLVWALANLVTGVLAVPLGLSAFPVAWQAHVGGFVFGLLALPAFEARRLGDGDPA